MPKQNERKSDTPQSSTIDDLSKLLPVMIEKLRVANTLRLPAGHSLEIKTLLDKLESTEVLHSKLDYLIHNGEKACWKADSLMYAATSYMWKLKPGQHKDSEIMASIKLFGDSPSRSEENKPNPRTLEDCRNVIMEYHNNFSRSNP